MQSLHMKRLHVRTEFHQHCIDFDFSPQEEATSWMQLRKDSKNVAMFFDELCESNSVCEKKIGAQEKGRK